MHPHPFFDAAAYPWHRQEAITFHVALGKHVNVKQADLIFCHCGGDSTHLYLQQAPTYVWRDVLNLLTVSRGLRRLCQYFAAPDSIYLLNAAFQSAIIAVEQAQPEANSSVEPECPEVIDEDTERMADHLTLDMPFCIQLRIETAVSLEAN